MIHCLVLDLGAGSGRAMLATYDGTRLDLTEIHRFAGYAVDHDHDPRWDVALLLGHVDEALRCARDACGTIDAIGVDSWGLDYALFDAEGAMMGRPYHHRHARSTRGYRDFPHPAARNFAATGAQDLPVNTLFQLYDEARHHPERHAGASRLLMIADVVNHHLTGGFRSEVTLARTSGLLEADTDAWSRSLCDQAGVPFRLLQPPIHAGERWGSLRPTLAEPLGWPPVPVIAVAAHDTASAVAALGLDDGSGFLICGSWMLIGVEQHGIDTREAVRRAGFGNEGGVEGRSFLVRSLDGLHLVRKLRESWRRHTGEDLTFSELSRRAAACAEGSAIDPADPLFFDPPDMIEAMAAFFARRGETSPGEAGSLARAVYAGLAAQVGRAALALEGLLGRPLPSLRLCGGGAQDPVLCALVARATGKPLRIGPIEASAWGNAILQLRGLGAIASLDEGRRLVERSAALHDPTPIP